MINGKALPVGVFIYYGITILVLLMLGNAFAPEPEVAAGVGAAAPAASGIEEVGAALLQNGGAEAAPAQIQFFNARAASLFVALICTIVFTVPLAWTYGLSGPRSKQHGSILETIFLLPLTVAFVVIIVQHSIALAFSLAGIVAAVRFRSNIKTPGDAVFVFAALAIGLAAGVLEIGVAGIGSMFFCLTYIALRMAGIVKDGEVGQGEREDADYQTDGPGGEPEHCLPRWDPQGPEAMRPGASSQPPRPVMVNTGRVEGREGSGE